MIRLAERSAALLLVGLSAACAPAPVPVFPAACPICARQESPDPPFASDGMLPARFLELNTSLITHATLTNTEPHLRTGLGVELAPGLTRNGRVRWVLSTALSGGAWGDQRHGRVMVEGATGLKVSFLTSMQLFDLYGIATEGVLAGWSNLAPGDDNEVGNVAGGGIGLRLFRALAVEATVHDIYAFGSPFTAVGDGSTTRSIPDFAVAINLDLCALGTWCDRTPQTQGSDDATCAIYTDAKAICAAMSREARPQLCQDAVRALAIKEQAAPLLARDAFRTFLADLGAAEAGTPRAPLVTALSATNACLEGWRSCGRRQECLLAQQGQTVETRRIYAPYALEMLGALGCNTDGTITPDCSYTCEDPGSKPAVCRERP